MALPLQLLDTEEQIQGLRVRQGSHIAHRAPVDHVGHRELGQLARTGAGQILNGHDDAPGRGAACIPLGCRALTSATSPSSSATPSAPAVATARSGCRRPTPGRTRATRAPRGSARPAGRSRRCRCARRRGSAWCRSGRDDDAAVGCPHGEVALRPDAGIPLEVGGPVRSRRRPQNPSGIDGNGRCTPDHRAHRPPASAPVLVPHVDRQAECRPLDLPRVAPVSVGSPPTRQQPHRSVPPRSTPGAGPPSRRVHPLERLGRGQGEPVEVTVRSSSRPWVTAPPQIRLRGRIEVLGTTPNSVTSLLLRDVDQRVGADGGTATRRRAPRSRPRPAPTPASSTSSIRSVV